MTQTPLRHYQVGHVSGGQSAGAISRVDSMEVILMDRTISRSRTRQAVTAVSRYAACRAYTGPNLLIILAHSRGLSLWHLQKGTIGHSIGYYAASEPTQMREAQQGGISIRITGI